MRIINEYKDDLSKAYMQTIDTLRNVVETRDKETKGHSERVSALASVLAEEMGLAAEVVEKIRVAGLFHDIGKIGVKDSILL
jgi:HD-GYP domain-containing protein (c-di-GMP phosphodiesterase class II)